MAKENKKVVVIDDLSKQFEEEIDATEVVFTPDIDQWTNLPSWALSNVEIITFRGEVAALSHSDLWCCENLKEIVFEKGVPHIVEDTFINCPKLNKLTFNIGISLLPLSAFCSDADFDKIKIKVVGVTRTINEWCKDTPGVFMFRDFDLPSGTLWDCTYHYVMHDDSNPVEPSIDDIYELLSCFRFECMSKYEPDDDRLIGDRPVGDGPEMEQIFLHPSDCLRFIVKISQSLKRGNDDAISKDE